MFTRNCVIFAYRLSTETVHVRTRRHVTWQIISARHRASERTSCFLRACQLSWEHNSACVNNINRLLSFDVVVWVACPAGRGHCWVLSGQSYSQLMHCTILLAICCWCCCCCCWGHVRLLCDVTDPGSVRVRPWTACGPAGWASSLLYCTVACVCACLFMLRSLC